MITPVAQNLVTERSYMYMYNNDVGQVPQINKVVWEFRGDLDSREVIRKDSRKEARDRYLINTPQLASSLSLGSRGLDF